MGLKRIERFKENEMSSLCEVWSYTDSSHSEAHQPPMEEERLTVEADAAFRAKAGRGATIDSNVFLARDWHTHTKKNPQCHSTLVSGFGQSKCITNTFIGSQSELFKELTSILEDC